MLSTDDMSTRARKHGQRHIRRVHHSDHNQCTREREHLMTDAPCAVETQARLRSGEISQDMDTLKSFSPKLMSLHEANCYMQSCSKANTCRGCGHVIYDQYFLMVSQECWHIQCLKCSDCHVELEAELTCFIRDGLVFCRADYYKRYAAKNCAACSQMIDCAEMVMRARDCVFHLECFACVHCKRVLNTGDSFGMSGTKVYCHVDYQTFAVQKQTRRKKENGEGRSRKRKQEVLDCEGLTFQDGFSLDGRAHCGTKTKRVRTSFKQHQLLIMKTYFALNHNPDSKDLKQLSIKTGLSKRVLQVWFQNARAKYRRVVTQRDMTEGGHLHCELEQ